MSWIAAGCGIAFALSCGRLAKETAGMAEEQGALACKIGLVYEKTDRSRFFSHHDLMRFFERAGRRAGLPLRLTQGFNPKPRIIFLQPLSLGIASHCEHVELELWRRMAPEAVMERLAPLMLPGMKLVSARNLPPLRKGRRVAATHYGLIGFSASQGAALAEAAKEFASLDKVEAKRQSKEGVEKIVDLKASAAGMAWEEGILEFAIQGGVEPVARPDEVRHWICQKLGCDQDCVSMAVLDREVVLAGD